MPPAATTSRIRCIGAVGKSLTFALLATTVSLHTAFAQFRQDGPKLIGGGAVAAVAHLPGQGSSVAISADGDTVIIGDPNHGDCANSILFNCPGAAWVFTRKGEVWSQQGTKLIGTGAAGAAGQGYSVALSADGDVAIIGGPFDGCIGGVQICPGAAWVFARVNGVWEQQGPKFVATVIHEGAAGLGSSVALSADGKTAITGGPGSYNRAGAAWAFSFVNGAWSEQSELTGGYGQPGEEQGWSVAVSGDGGVALVGAPYIPAVFVFARANGSWQFGTHAILQGTRLGYPEKFQQQGSSVALSYHGEVALEGGPGGEDRPDHHGNAWVFTEANGAWTQRGDALTGTAGGPLQNIGVEGVSSALSADGSTAIVGGPNFACDPQPPHCSGATWVFTRTGTVWSQQAPKLIGTGAVGKGGAMQGTSIALSGDGDTSIVGGPADNANVGAAWVFTQPLAVFPYRSGSTTRRSGGAFTPASINYRLRATRGSVDYKIGGVPRWLTASSVLGTLTGMEKTIAFTPNAEARKLIPGLYRGTIEFSNSNGVQKGILRDVTLMVTQ